MSQINTKKNWFDQGGQAYADFRPTYPPQLATYLASVAPNLDLVLDVGCGNGQLTTQLADHFTAVVGMDPSADQLVNIKPHDHIQYYCAAAERLPLAANSVSLITAAQAAHWFDLPAFYAEAKRVAIEGGVLALISYGVLQLEADLQARFEAFYWQEIGPYWPAERRLVDEGYRTIDFPFTELITPNLTIQYEWDLAQFLGYVSTWSAVRRARADGKAEILQAFAKDLNHDWKDPSRKRLIRWPLAMRVGYL